MWLGGKLFDRFCCANIFKLQKNDTTTARWNWSKMSYSFACLHYFQFWSEWFQWSFQVGINLLNFFWTSFYINLWRESVICIEYGLKSFWLWNADKRKDLQKAWIVEWFEDPDPQGIRVFIFLTISCFTEIIYLSSEIRTAHMQMFDCRQFSLKVCLHQGL